MSMFKVLDAEGVTKFREYAETHTPQAEPLGWETLHPVCRAVWHKEYRLCMECGVPMDKGWCKDKDHRNKEPDRVLLHSYLNAAFPGQDNTKLLSECRWYGSDGFWGVNMRGIFMGIEIDGYVHS